MAQSALISRQPDPSPEYITKSLTHATTNEPRAAELIHILPSLASLMKNMRASFPARVSSATARPTLVGDTAAVSSCEDLRWKAG
ncbi:hypothetical protein N7478_001483 [Penicillium angulare]|uniref:uncharacterized protein n=1 Tax=Penicillium angulare TaxID=116970 RepID=UPI0025424A58|nr:uncharacterized protein N7478_001483 [Penicillium angulare]KAJ5292232.1 hypothetical protein N7478_001483 [Penicillium angulare]